MAELADALDLGSSALRRGGSTPFTRIRGSSSVVEHHLAKVGVAGSNPVFCSIISAGVAELADAQDLNPAVRDHRTGSIPVLGTILLLICDRSSIGRATDL